MKKPWCSQVQPLDEWVLVRAVSRETTVLVPTMSPDGKTVTGARKQVHKPNHGTVVAVGPGGVSTSGSLIPVDPKIRPGATVAFPGKSALRHEDFEAEMTEDNLWLVPASMCMFVLSSAPVAATHVMA